MDFYELLGLGRDARVEEIKRAYRRLARKFHPDINPGDRMAAVRFQAVAQAYETLSDQERRRQYDLCGRHVQAVEVTSSIGFEGFDFSVDAAHGRDASTFGDLFAEVIQQSAGARAAEPAAGADLHASVAIGFGEAMRGAERAVNVVRRIACRRCHGVGAIAAAEVTCPACRGAGTIRSARGHMLFVKTCGRCGGKGNLQQTPCGVCGGGGMETRSEPVAIHVPPGVADGDRLRVAGGGHEGTRGGAAGDLYVTIHVAPGRLFRREGDDLHLVVPVAVHEAALGAKVEIPTFDGQVRLRVPPGTQSGQRFRLRERGAPSARGGPRGDLVAEVRLVLPSLLDERSKELMREFGRINGEDVRRRLWADAPPGSPAPLGTTGTPE